MELGSITQSLTQWLTKASFWTIGIILLVVAIFFFYLVMSRKGKLKYNVLEIVLFGQGKVGLNLLKAGIFKSKTAFFGLLDYGEESIFKTKDGRRILNARTTYLHDVFGKKGFICCRKKDDARILVPLSKVDIDNLGLLGEIAPVDYRDASVTILKDAVKETTGTWEKILPYLAIGIIVILCIIAIIINQQMTNNTIDKVGKLLIEGCKNTQNIVPSGAP
jgi:hypothetical protein